MKPIVPIIITVLYYLMRIRIILLLLLTFNLPGLLTARIIESWTYQEMFDKADLVVIARTVSTNDTDERSALLDLKVIGVISEFKSLLVLKGSQNVTTFQLHHYRLQSESDENVVNGPDLVRITRPRQSFLLFLIKEKDKRYAPVGGQTDPAGYSVLELQGWAD